MAETECGGELLGEFGLQHAPSLVMVDLNGRPVDPAAHWAEVRTWPQPARLRTVPTLADEIGWPEAHLPVQQPLPSPLSTAPCMQTLTDEETP